MAPNSSKKTAAGKAKEKETKKDAKKGGEDEPKPKTFMEKHVLKFQLGLMSLAFLISVVPRVLNGHDRYRFEDSYKDPIAWHTHFAKEYTSLFDKFGYTLHTNASDWLQGHLGKASAGANILDVGAGSGLVGLELKKHGFQHITGIDIVPEILEQANATGAYERLIVSDAEMVPLEQLANASFDAVLCIGTSGYLGRGERDETGPALDRAREAQKPPAEASRVDALLQEWLRVLKPGGILGLTSEVLLKSAWEEAFHRMQEGALLTKVDEIGPMSLVPNNDDKTVAETKVHMYFHQKPM